LITGSPAGGLVAALAAAVIPPTRLPEGRSGESWSRRMRVVRGFARHMSGIDPATQVPPADLVTHRRHRRTPFIYSRADVEALINAVPRIVPTPLRAATVQTMIGLLAATGMRVGEVIALGRRDIDWADGVLVVTNSKFGKSREVPLDPTTVEALDRYVGIRDRWVRQPTSPAFFVSRRGTPVIYDNFLVTFRALVGAAGVGADSAGVPRVHDLRHSFAVRTLIRWYRAGEDVLSTYLGHLAPGYTYWYLSAVPELLDLAAARLDTAGGRRG
jgi:integrase